MSLYGRIMAFFLVCLRRNFQFFWLFAEQYVKMFSDRQRLITVLFPFTIELAYIPLLWLIVLFFGVQSRAHFYLTLNHDYISSSFSATTGFSLCHDCKSILFTKALISCRDMLLLLCVGLKMSERSAWTEPSLPPMPYILSLSKDGESFLPVSLQSELWCYVVPVLVGFFVCCKLPCVFHCCVFAQRGLAHAWEKRRCEARKSLNVGLKHGAREA